MQGEALHMPWAQLSRGGTNELLELVPTTLTSPVGLRHWAPESVNSPARAPEHCVEILCIRSTPSALSHGIKQARTRVGR